MDEKITFEDVMEYQHLFSLVPVFVLERMAKRNSNLVNKFKSTIQSYIDDLSEVQRNKLNIILASDVESLQDLMKESFVKTGKKQFEILSNPGYRDFIELNLDELRNMI